MNPADFDFEYWSYGMTRSERNGLPSSGVVLRSGGKSCMFSIYGVKDSQQEIEWFLEFPPNFYAFCGQNSRQEMTGYVLKEIQTLTGKFSENFGTLSPDMSKCQGAG